MKPNKALHCPLLRGSNCAKVRGDAQINYNSRGDKIVTGYYVATAKFKGGKATIKVRLVRLHSHWEIQGLHVNSPALLQ